MSSAAAVLRTVRLALDIAVVGTLVLADAAEIRRQAADRYVGDTVRQQLADADWLLLNKPDLVAEGDMQAVTQAVAALAPRARVWAGAATALPAELVLGWRGHELPEPPARSADEAFGARPMAPPPAAANAVFDSHSLGLPAGVDLAALGAELAAPDSGVLRAKGLALDTQGQGWLLQVAGGRWALTPAAVNGPGRLVLIGLRGRWDPARLGPRPDDHPGAHATRAR